MEIERKFVPAQLPSDLSKWQATPIIQAYLSTDPVIRIRREGSNYLLTCKGRGLMIREEFNLPLTREAFLKLLPKCDGHIIQKTRYRAPVEHMPSLTAELDLFEGEWKGLTILEVEFPSPEAAAAFVPPAWYGEGVTKNPAYHNASLSRGVDPRVPQGAPL